MTYVPLLSTNILSVSTMVKRGIKVIFSEDGCKIYHKCDCQIKGDVKATASNVDGIYKLDLLSKKACVAVQKSTRRLWHRRLGHLNRTGMRLLKTGLVYKLSKKIL